MERVTLQLPPPYRSYTSNAVKDIGSPPPSYSCVSEAHPAPAPLSSFVSSAAAVCPYGPTFCPSADLPVLHPVRLDPSAVRFAGVAVRLDPSAAPSVQETWISSDCSPGLGLSSLCLFPIELQSNNFVTQNVIFLAFFLFFYFQTS